LEHSIQLLNINKSFSNKVVFSNLSYNFGQNNYHLIGQNGAGKSTLLRLIVGMDVIDSGTILINGQNINRNKQIYYVPDDLDIYPFLTGEEFLSWIAMVRFSTPNELNKVIEQLELKIHLNTSVGDMSFGTKKEFLLASALIGNPDFIILDEPLNGLDKNSQQVLLSILKEKAFGTGIIFSTHHDANIELLSPIKVQILNNKLIEKTSVSEVI
jgi:ABC-2 type transport system ATP-binding protein